MSSAPSTGLDKFSPAPALSDDMKKMVAQMVKDQVEAQVASQMAAFKEAYK